MSTATIEESTQTIHQIEELETVTIRFCGDSGDGMQLTGTQFTATSAILGNDISTLPDFPAEIRAPQGSLPGVSGFQLNFSSRDIRTPGDEPDVLVAMNPAALKTNLQDLLPGGILLVNTDEFTDSNFKKASIKSNPLEDERLSPVQTADHAVDAEVAGRIEAAVQTARALQELLRAGPDVLAL